MSPITTLFLFEIGFCISFGLKNINPFVLPNIRFPFIVFKLEFKLNWYPSIPSIFVKFIIFSLFISNLFNPLLVLIQILLLLSTKIELIKLFVRPSDVVYELNLFVFILNLLRPILVPIHKFPELSKLIQFILLLISEFLSLELYCSMTPFSLSYLTNPIPVPPNHKVLLSSLSCNIYFIPPGLISNLVKFSL